MTSNEALIAGAVIAALFSVSLIGGLIDRFAHPWRMEMAKTGKALLSDPALSARHKRVVDKMLDDAYRSSALIEFLIFFPVYVVVKLLKDGGKLARMPETRSEETNLNLRKFMHAYVIAICCANPIAAIVFGIFAITAKLIALLMELCFHHLMNLTGIFGASMEFIENSHWRGRFSRIGH